MFLMGDDHEFQEDILVRLLERDVDVVVPLVMRRLPPFQLVLYKGEQEQEGSAPPEYEYIWHWELPHSGLMEVYAAGTAGMLVRRHVLDAVGPPWFSTTHGIQNEDLEFCRKVREAGFKIWADTELYLGHIVTGSIHSARRDGKWGYVIEFGPGDEIFVVPTRPSAVVMPEDAESRIVVPPGVR